MIIAITGESRHGENITTDILVDHLVLNHSVQTRTIRFSAPIYDICESIRKTCDVDKAKNKIILDGIAALTKSVYGQGVWARVSAKKVDPRMINIVADLKSYSEMGELVFAANEHNIRLITLRIARPGCVNDAGPKDELDNLGFTHTIEADLTIPELTKKLHDIVDKYIEHFPV